MSWSLSQSSVPAESLAETLTAAFEDAYPDPAPGVRDQVDTAVAAAGELAGSGEAGPGPYTVSLNGHVPGDGDGTTPSIGVYVSTPA